MLQILFNEEKCFKLQNDSISFIFMGVFKLLFWYNMRFGEIFS